MLSAHRERFQNFRTRTRAQKGGARTGRAFLPRSRGRGECSDARGGRCSDAVQALRQRAPTLPSPASGRGQRKDGEAMMSRAASGKTVPPKPFALQAGGMTVEVRLPRTMTARDYEARYRAEVKTLRRHYCTLFAFWKGCGFRPCRRARACAGDALACLKRNEPGCRGKNNSRRGRMCLMQRPPTSARRSGWRGRRCRVDCAGDRSSSPPHVGEGRAQRCQRGQVFGCCASVEAAPPTLPSPASGRGEERERYGRIRCATNAWRCRTGSWLCPRRTTARSPSIRRRAGSSRTASRPRTGCGRRPFP